LSTRIQAIDLQETKLHSKAIDPSSIF
jgi:hypothetical protein